MNAFSKIKISHKLPNAIILLAIFAATLMLRLRYSKAKNIFIAKLKIRLISNHAHRTRFYDFKSYGQIPDAPASFGARAITAANYEGIGVQAYHVSGDRFVTMIRRYYLTIGATFICNMIMQHEEEPL